jgi:hypothetical protein
MSGACLDNTTRHSLISRADNTVLGLATGLPIADTAALSTAKTSLRSEKSILSGAGDEPAHMVFVRLYCGSLVQKNGCRQCQDQLIALYVDKRDTSPSVSVPMVQRVSATELF